MAGVESKPKIGCSPNGPYYLLNDMEVRPVPNLRRASGEPCANVRAVALCRCGSSKNKPFCDGTHSVIGFKDAKTADPAKDKREAYKGRRITILDNRSICAHAGFCYRDEGGTVRLLHASTTQKAVILDEELATYLARVPTHTGIMVARPLEVA